MSQFDLVNKKAKFDYFKDMKKVLSGYY